MATKYITEILEEINKDPKTIEKYKNNVALKFVFEYAFLPENKFILPEGSPPYKPDPAPIGMSPSNLYQEVKKLYIFCRKDLTPLKREILFIGLVENVHPLEAELLVCIKDQCLPNRYKNITHKLVAEAGFIRAPEPKAKKETKSKNSTAPLSGAE
jgi:hypothetical protein